MFKRFAALAALLVLFNLAMGQTKPAYTFNKGTGECLYPDVTLDAAWSAATKVLMQGKFRIISAEKPSGTLTAERRQEWAYQYQLTLYFEQIGPDVRIVASCDVLHHQEGLGGLVQKSGQNKAHEKLERKFFDKLAEALK